ncbi:hypothetical protein CcaverHIS002_0600900 [Cutaneotrichosporon cavernicola]|uniref:Uncharacterized protein n=1 Tax=Cutaneotrichosporon cavernicola TaxID=279322 RepID=A0AA48L5S2_9TREE|nr:uncharacterized protein CcaverHIS019_0501000 [Cutaneotrichosporon cavernicola]BEI85803.1 hypothetical protein CcaverHIS002_0600900 [Cutaneotrichosporon cavernicola]BEI92472.1 hypothetical protein CcaverHIS019_0501000 [Cutaneotrichosporon cavernicola]
MLLFTAALLVAPALALPLESAFAHGRYIASLNLVTRQHETRQQLTASIWGTCGAECSGISDTLRNDCGVELQQRFRRDVAVCEAACKTDYKGKLSQCDACLKGLTNETDSTLAGQREVATWESFMASFCPTSTTPPETTNPEPLCSQCTALYPRVMTACNTSNPDTCRGLCGDLDAINSCVECYGDGYDEYKSYARDAQWYCTTDGGKGCSRMMDDVGKLCGDDQTHCNDICTGDNWADIKQCEDAVPNSGLTGSQGPTILDGIGSFNTFCAKVPPEVIKTGCAKECDAIRGTYGDLCRDKQATKCQGMCSPDNLGSFEACNSCSQGGNSTYTDDTKSSISASLTTLTAWCIKVETNPIDNPEVINTIPDPTPVETVEIVPVDPKDTKDPGTLKNPFTKSDSSNSSTESKGIPTWGIGVAAGGGALLLAGVVGSIIACNYQCDHDHRRLRRRRRKNKKKDDDEKPQQQQPPPQQEPQIVGYMVPSERPPSQGYFAGPASPPMGTPLSPPVSMAHTPIGPGPISPPQSPPPMSPPGSPPPMGYAYPQQQFGQQQYGQQQYGQHYPPYPPHQGGQQY